MPRPEKSGKGGTKNMKILDKSRIFITLYGENPGIPGSNPGNPGPVQLYSKITLLIRLLIWISKYFQNPCFLGNLLI